MGIDDGPDLHVAVEAMLVSSVPDSCKVTYEAVISVKGKKSEIQIAEDGTLIK